MKTKKKVVLISALLTFALAIAAASRFHAPFADYWAQHCISLFVRCVSTLSSWVSFPLTEIFAGLLALLAIVMGVRCAAKRKLHAFAINCLCVLALLGAGYLALWYPLYFAPVASPYTIAKTAQTADVEALSKILIDKLSALNAQTISPRKLPGLAASALNALDALPFFAETALPKAARYPEWMHKFMLAGIYAPWTAEAMYSPFEPTAAQPFTACHELAHLRGIADEGQANIAAYEACVQAGGAFERSAYLHALANALPRLRSDDYSAWEKCISRLDELSISELRQMGGLTGGNGTQSRDSAVACMFGLGSSLSSYGALVDYLAQSHFALLQA